MTRAEIYVLWDPPPVDRAALRRVVADVQASLRAGRCAPDRGRCSTEPADTLAPAPTP